MLKVILLIDIPEIMQNDFYKLLNLVSLSKQERIMRFHFVRDAYNCLLGDILARIEICMLTGLNNDQLEFSVNSYGKPFLSNMPNIHYNISHSGKYIACAISDEPIGIDIELIEPVNLKVAERFFTQDETAYIMNCEQQYRQYRFFEVWTKKESRIKLDGKGLYKLPSFSVFDSQDQKSSFYHTVFYDGKAVCHLCSNKKGQPSINVIHTDKLLQHIKNSPSFSFQ